MTRARRQRAPSSRALAAYVEGEVTPSEGIAIEAALTADPGLRQVVAGMRRVKQRFGVPHPDAEAIDLVASIRAATAARGEAIATPSAAGGTTAAAVARAAAGGGAFWRRRRPLGLVAALAAVGGVAAVVVVALPGQPARNDLRSKSAAADPSTAEIARFTGVRVFRAPAGGAAPKRLSGTMSGREGLLFDYMNGSARPFSHLMIFGVGATGDLYWYFPAYQQGGTDGAGPAEREKGNPASMAITAGGRAALDAIIYHDLPSGRLVLHALFTSRPLRVLEVETWMKSRRPGDPLPWRAAYEQVIETNVMVGGSEDASGRTRP